MNVNLNKVKKRASLNGDDRISTENSEPFFKGSLVEICILSYVPYSFSEKHSLKHELMPFFSETRLGKIGRWLLNPQDSSLSEKHISALEQSAAAELAICAAMKNSGRPFAPSDYAYKESGQPTIQNGHISISHTEGYAACAIAREPVGIDVERGHTFSKAAAKRILSPQEELMSDSTNADELLSRIWTVKESFLKMTLVWSWRPQEITIFSLCGEELAAIVIAYCCLGILLCRTGRHSFPPFAPHMRPTPASCKLRLSNNRSSCSDLGH